MPPPLGHDGLTAYHVFFPPHVNVYKAHCYLNIFLFFLTWTRLRESGSMVHFHISYILDLDSARYIVRECFGSLLMDDDLLGTFPSSSSIKISI